MTDTYLSIAAIANSRLMYERVLACATEQAHLGNTPLISSPVNWVGENNYLWAASPGWGEAWVAAVAAHQGEQNYKPDKDETVITDEMIRTTIQRLGSPQED